jgi:tetratricopeptide (TPR) repeat protein
MEFARQVKLLLLARAVAVSLCVSITCVSAGAQAPSRRIESSSASLISQLNHAIGIAEHGDRQQALALADALLEKHPDFVPALKLKGMLLEETGRGPEAARAYEKALKIMPNDPGLLFNFGVNQLALGDNDQAIRLFLRHLSIQPKDADAHFYLAQAYHRNGQEDLALEAVRECVKIAPGNAQAWQKYGELTCGSGDNDAGLRLLLKARQLDATLERIDFDIGTASYNSMDFANAARSSARAVEKQPRDLNALALLASSEVKLSHWQEARSVFERILAIKSDDGDSLLGLGDCQLELKQYVEAINTLRRALAVDPSQSQAHYYLSRAYAALGRTDEARHEADLHRRIDQMSFGPTPLGSEGNKPTWDQARRLLAEHREDEALSLFQRSSEGTYKTAADAHTIIGSLYLSMGEEKDALRNLHRALEIDSAVRGAHTYLGLAALQANDLEVAEREFLAELANDRNYLPAIAGLGEVRYRQQRWAEAAELLSNSRTSDPMNEFMLCDSFFHLGKTQDAELTAEVVASRARSDPEIMRALVELLNHNGASDLARRLSENHP